MRTAKQLKPILRVKEIEACGRIRLEVYDYLKKEGPLSLRQLLIRTKQKESTIRRAITRMEALKEIKVKLIGKKHYYSIKYSPSK